jgi:uncharacterized lipoprotein YehR (DUF1307 family)
MKRSRKLIALAFVLTLIVGATGCQDSWERTTFQTLSASKKILDDTSAAYRNGYVDEVGKRTPFPRNEASYKAITALGDAQNAAVQAFATYEQLKLASNDKSAIARAKVDVEVALARLPALVAAVRQLYDHEVKPLTR